MNLREHLVGQALAGYAAGLDPSYRPQMGKLAVEAADQALDALDQTPRLPVAGLESVLKALVETTECARILGQDDGEATAAFKLGSAAIKQVEKALGR